MKTILILLITLVLSSCKKEVPEPPITFPLEKLRDLNDHINPVRVDTIKY